MNHVLINKVRELQKQECCEPCFRSGKGYCEHSERCCWAEICLSEYSPLVKAPHIFYVKE